MQPGTVLQLHAPLWGMFPGRYVLTEFDAGATVHNVVRNEDGEFSPGSYRIRLTWHDLDRFEVTGQVIPIGLGARNGDAAV